MAEIGDLKAELKNGKIRQAYLIYGDDEGYIRELFKEIKKAIGVDEEDIFSFNKFDGEKVGLDELNDSIVTVPFMSDRKVIEIDRAGFLNKNNETRNTKDMANSVKEFFKEPLEGTYLISYYVTKNDEKAPDFDYLVKSSHKEKSMVIRLKNVAKQQVGDFLNSFFKNSGASISRPLLAYIRETFEGSIMQLESDLNKIVDYANGEEISKEMVNLLLTKSSKKDIFDLLGFIFSGKTKDAMELYNDMIYRKSDFGGILVKIEDELLKIYNYKMAMGANLSELEMKKEVSEYRQWLFEKNKKLASSISLTTLSTMIEEVMNMEERFKTTSTDEKRELELLILTLSSSMVRQ